MKSIVRSVGRFFLFWYQFILGDDPVGALIVIGGFVAALFFTRAGGVFFWFLPAVVIVSVLFSLVRLARAAEGGDSPENR